MNPKSLLTIVTLMLCFLIPGLAKSQVAQVDAVVSYTEPDKTVSGPSLKQLQHTTIYLR